MEVADCLKPTSSSAISGGDRTAIIRLVGAALAEQHDEGRRYLGLGVLTRFRAVLTSPDNPADKKPTTTPALTA